MYAPCHCSETTYLNKTLCNVPDVYRQAQNLSGVDCAADFDTLAPAIRKCYIRNVLLEHFENPRHFYEGSTAMSRLRTAVSHSLFLVFCLH